ncbi:MAG TPA: twin-arginine translocase TatA/TatE family subunit [Vicinamibacterales bacterium]
MLSPSDTILIFVVALLLFGPEQVPKIARQLGDAMRHVQNTTSSFMAEMDRAAAAAEIKSQPVWEPPSDASWQTVHDDGATPEHGGEETASTAHADSAPDAAPADAASIDESKPPA